MLQYTDACPGIGTRDKELRIYLSFEAEAENVSSEEIIDRLYETIPTP